MLRLEPYRPDWAVAYSVEAARVRAALGRMAVAIEHVGSTAVPGMMAKPVIDIGVAVGSLADADACIALLEYIGYEYRGVHGEDPDRRYYVLQRDGLRHAQLHLYILPAPAWEQKLRFRDLLLARPEVAAAYAAEKIRVARLVGWDKAAYSVAKGPFIDAALAQAASGDDAEPSGGSRTR